MLVWYNAPMPAEAQVMGAWIEDCCRDQLACMVSHPVVWPILCARAARWRGGPERDTRLQGLWAVWWCVTLSF